ncbi:glutamate synthase [NADH] [Clonorchis sinensis]|uniref:Glutamate synthase [NADH] n=2 Tax=Clonorchis sinensis TaxID=79923 RepID=A0A8T1MHC2_CLOSI|nr:glutamate synthase [NADH] [Clonorchis sinensis]GAA42453.2 excitatory amino acid transporter [Clonorchis sinensis]
MDESESQRKTSLLSEHKNSEEHTRRHSEKKISYTEELGATETKLQMVKRWFCDFDNIFVLLTVAAVVLGMTIGLAVKVYADPSRRTIYLVSFPGELLMNMFKMLIIPLIVSSLVAGLANLDPKSSGKIGSYALIYYVVTTLLATVLGIVLVLSIHPGNPNIRKNLGEGTIEERRPETLDSVMDLLRNLFPENLIQACIQQQQSFYVNVTAHPKYLPAIRDALLNSSELADNLGEPVTEEIVKPRYMDSTNVLGLVSFSIMFGLILGQMGDKAVVMVQFFSILSEVIMHMVKAVMLYSPFGIFFLILGKVLEIENLKETATSLGMYMLTVISGLAIHCLGTLALLYFVFTRKNPFKFYRGVFQAWITALGTSSSAATLPITFRCLENNLKIDKRVTRFVLPIGATINMDGTALYEAVASIFIAQINAKELSVVEVIVVSLTATLAAIGAASVPSAGLVTMMLVLTSVGLPTKDISLILAVDWMLDRIRTSINVMGDAVGAGIVDHLCRKELEAKDAEIERELDEAVEEYTHIITTPTSTSAVDSNKQGRRRWSKKRMSVAAALKLQENASPISAAIPTSAIVDHANPFTVRDEHLEDIDA